MPSGPGRSPNRTVSVLLLFGTRLAALADALAIASADAPATASQPPVVVFVAGWEGTGHHFLDAVFQGLSVPRIMLKDNWSQYGMMRAGKSWDPADIPANVAHLKAVAAEHPGELVEIMAATSGSYPNGQGSHAARMSQRQPNIELLGGAARSAGVDLRVVVTRRSAEETLVATCMHRSDLEPCREQAQTLAENMRVLVGQLRALGASAFRCTAYGDLGNIGKGLALILAGTGKAQEVDALVAEAWEGDAHHDSLADTEEVHRMAEPMRAPMEELDGLCSEAERHHASGRLPVAAVSEAGLSAAQLAALEYMLPAHLPGGFGRLAAAQ